MVSARRIGLAALMVAGLSLTATGGVKSADEWSPRIAIAASEWSSRVEPETLDGLRDALRVGYPQSTVRLLDARALLEAKAAETWDADLLVLPDAATVPLDVAIRVLDYLEAGGNLLSLGGILFENPLVRANEGYVPLHEALSAAPSTPLDAPQANPEAWWVESDQPDRARPLERAKGPSPDRPALRLITAFSPERIWETRALAIPEGAFTEGHPLATVWLRTDPDTPEVLLECVEADGSRWMAVAATGPEWSRAMVREEDFRFWYDGSNPARGYPGDRLRLSRVVCVKLGLARSHQAVADGERRIEFADLGAARSPVDEEALRRVSEPLECYRPAYKTYALTNVEAIRPWQAEDDGGWMPWRDAPDAVRCAIPRWRGTTLGAREDWRWEPIAEARSRDGGSGTFLWRLIHVDGPYAGGIWVHAGIPPRFAARGGGTLGLLLHTALSQAGSPAALATAGSTHAAVFEGEPVVYGATVRLLVPEAAADWFIAARIVNASGETFARFRRQAAFSGAVGSATHVWQPGRGDRGVFRVFAELQDGAGRVVDALDAPFRVIATPNDPAAAFVRVVDGEFRIGNDPWVPYGVNFWPRTVAGLDSARFQRHWLSPEGYDGDWVERELAILAGLGMNAVSIQINDVRQARPAADFLDRCRQQGIRANVYLAGMHPVESPDNTLWTSIIAEGRLGRNAAVYAWDVAWEPHFGNVERRARWDGEWTDWLIEQYGSPEAAESDWGAELPRRQDRPASPSDEQLAADGPWRVMVAAYRRFADDLISRAYGRRKREALNLAPYTLFGCRTGWGGTGTEWAQRGMQYDLASGARHLDFLSPEGWGYAPGHIHEAGILTAYAHCVSGGKPVFWSEFGHNITFAAPADQAAWQERTYREFYAMIERSGGRGAAGWWYPGGYRVNENSDYGIVNPDGTLRPAASTSRDYADRLRRSSAAARIAPARLMDRDADARGMYGIRLAVRDDWPADGHAPLRTAGTGRTSVDAPALAIGNTPMTGNNPPKFLNAEFDWFMDQDLQGHWFTVVNGGSVHWDGQNPLRFQTRVGNTGEAAWIADLNAAGQPGAVALQCAFEDGPSIRIPLVENVAPLADYTFAEFTLHPPDRDRSECVIRMDAMGRGSFGEKFRITVVRSAQRAK